MFLEIGNSAGFFGVKRTFPEIDAAALCKCEVSRMVTRCQIPRTKAPRITNVKKKGVDRTSRICAFSAAPGLTSTSWARNRCARRERWRCNVKYGWIAIVTMIGTLLSPGLVAAQSSDERVHAKEG